MKSIKNLILLAAGITGLLVACDKADSFPSFGPGTTATLSTSSATVAPLPADSNNTALTLSWTFPNHATDSNNIKYTIEIDSTGKNFARASTKNCFRKIKHSIHSKRAECNFTVLWLCF